MIRATLTALALLASPVSAQEQPTAPEVLWTELRGHRIILLEDGTWHFANSGISLGLIQPFSQGGCLATSDGRIRYCGLPEGFTPGTPVSINGNEEYSFRDRTSGITFTLTHDSHYGHQGDLGYYREIEARGGAGGDFMTALIGFVSGFELDGEQAWVRDGIALSTGGYNYAGEAGIGLANFAFDAMTASETLSLSVTAFSDEDTRPELVDDLVSRLTANIAIDGKPLAAWKAAE